MQTRLDLQKVLLEHEEAAILAEADNRLYSDDRAERRKGLTVWLALSLGLRVSELQRLDWLDFDFASGAVEVWRHKKGCGKRHGAEVPATDDRDTVYPARALWQRIAGLAGIGSVFGSVTDRTLKRDWAELAQAAGLRRRCWGIHSARHTAATRIGRQTGRVESVRDFLGHSDKSISITMQYIGRDPLRLKQAADDSMSKYDLRPAVIQEVG